MSPHEALYGYAPRLIHLDIEHYRIPEVSVENRVRLLQEAHQQAMETAYAVRDSRNKASTFKPPREYLPGDFVKVTKHARHKLSPHWKGPYRIISRTGKVTYRIEVGPGERMHTNIHVSHLRPWHMPDDSPDEQKAKATEPLAIPVVAWPKPSHTVSPPFARRELNPTSTVQLDTDAPLDPPPDVERRVTRAYRAAHNLPLTPPKP